MANPNYDQKRREEANVGGMHEHRDDDMSWTDRDDRSDRSEGRQQGESDQHHHHHHHHHGSEGQQSDRDYERLAEKARERVQSFIGDDDQSRQHGGIGSQQGHDFGGEDRGHTNRFGSRGANDPGTSRSPRTERRQSGGHSGQHGTDHGIGSHHEQGRQQRGQSGKRRYGQRREQRGSEGRQHGTPHEGSQRGSNREEGLSGRMTGQRGESTHHSDPSDSTFRQRTSGERKDRHGGEQGTSERDRRYGSRRGHGSERDTERRHSSQ